MKQYSGATEAWPGLVEVIYSTFSTCLQVEKVLYYFLKHMIHHHYTVIKVIYTMFIKDSMQAQTAIARPFYQSPANSLIAQVSLLKINFCYLM